MEKLELMILNAAVEPWMKSGKILSQFGLIRRPGRTQNTRRRRAGRVPAWRVTAWMAVMYVEIRQKVAAIPGNWYLG